MLSLLSLFCYLFSTIGIFASLLMEILSSPYEIGLILLIAFLFWSPKLLKPSKGL